MKNYFIIIFISTLIVITSVVKNSTRKLEAKIFNSEEQIKILSDKKKLILLENTYLSSPERLFGLKRELLDENFITMKLEKIIPLESYENNLTGRIIIKKHNSDLDNFYESKFKIDLNRVAFIFVIIFTFILLYSTRVIYLSSKTFQNNSYKINKIKRADITDRHGNYISKSVFTTNVGIDPMLVKDKKKLLL